MRWLSLMAMTLVMACGCGSLPPDAASWTAGPVVAVGQPNPLFVACHDPQAVWETVVDVVDNYFRVEHEEPVRVIGATVTEGRLETYPEPGATVFEPWRWDSVGAYERIESTLQSIRRRAQVRVTPGQGGYWVDVAVFKELENAHRPCMSTAGAATFHYDSSLVRVESPIVEQDICRGWIPYGRDDKLEQRVLGQIQGRIAGYGAPVRVGANLEPSEPAAR